MKRRFVETRKILAVAPLAIAAAGCGASSSSEGVPVATAPVTTGVPAAPAQPEPVVATPPASPAPDPPRTPGVEAPSRANDPALLALRSELAREPKGALGAPDRYRPLCDKDGFPLVGNVMRKGAPENHQPSQLCADLRAQAKR